MQDVEREEACAQPPVMHQEADPRQKEAGVALTVDVPPSDSDRQWRYEYDSDHDGDGDSDENSDDNGGNVLP